MPADGRFAEGKKEPLSRKNLGKAARNALGKGTGPLNLPGTAVGIFLSGLQKWAQKSPEVVETSELFCVGIYFGAPSCVMRTLWINGLFFRLLIVICKILSAFNQFCHDLIELHSVFR
ncbi:MAG: hypothetical protein V8T00_09790 [Oscillospiraceae bacterium]